VNYNFDEIIDRKNTNSLKYDFIKERGMPEGILPLWVADIDFKIPPDAMFEILERTNHGIFGYSDPKEDYFQAVQNWFFNGFGYNSNPEWIVITPGVIFAISMAIKAYTKKGDFILIQKPVYYPFEQIININERRCVSSDLIIINNKYHINFDDFEKKISEYKVKAFILCSPHNPVGRVWTKYELIKVGEICLKHNCIVISDEIHCDIVYAGNQHHMFPTVHTNFAMNTVVCTAPSKTFSLAGIQHSNTFIANPELRDAFKKEIAKSGYCHSNIMGLIACKAVYSFGFEWVQQLKQYLIKNILFLKEFLSKRLPEIKMIDPESMYLVWLDFRALNLSQEKLDDLITKCALVWLSSGTIFGSQGQGYMRINIGCPKKVLEEALLRIENAVCQLR